MCAVDAFYLDDGDRAVLAAGRSVSAYGTGDAELDVAATWDLKPWIPFGDCVVGIAPDWSGLVWWVSRDGLVGTIEPDSGRVAVIDLAESVRHGLAVDQGGAYVVSEDALRRLTAGPDGTPQVGWRTEYSGGSGSAPVLLDGGAVAITDELEDRLGVAFLARDSGAALCRQSVFEKGDGSTDSTLASLGRGVVVANNHGYRSPRSTLLGFTSDPGISRVDLVDGACVLRWTSEAVSPELGHDGQLAQRAGLRLDQAAVAHRCQRVVPHRPRRRLRPLDVERAHRHRADGRQRRLADHPRPRRLGVARHPRRPGPRPRPPLRPEDPRRTAVPVRAR